MTTKKIVYEVRFGQMDQSEPLTITGVDLLEYVNGNWSALATPLRKLAEMDGLIITYHFANSAGVDFRTIKVGPETYSQLRCLPYVVSDIDK